MSGLPESSNSGFCERYERFALCSCKLYLLNTKLLIVSEFIMQQIPIMHQEIGSVMYDCFP